VVIWIDWSI